MSKIIDEESGYSRKQDAPDDLLEGFSPKPKENDGSEKSEKSKEGQTQDSPGRSSRQS